MTILFTSGSTRELAIVSDLHQKKLTTREMIFVQLPFDNFLSHTHIMFLLSLSIALFIVSRPLFLYKIMIFCQSNGCSNNTTLITINEKLIQTCHQTLGGQIIHKP